ncbi:Rdx family-domain-containing protein [Chaetomium tenue]|uniref:Rdx family-domain-containing protein n=1 Tax=Chaetomium tenue TaxID=1854479 RepID=A0ACB7P3P9_9PEZI|nr:Rdx family-domain-containing protein [Chaetomium globosum]
MAETTPQSSEPRLPRVTIQFCTQCKWMLRAAYYAQELLSTFSVSLGEVALQPATGGVFVVEIATAAAEQPATATTTSTSTATATPTSTPTRQTKAVLWDRKIDGGFPEVKELKRRVRDVIQPGRDLGHVDRDYGRSGQGQGQDQGEGGEGGAKKEVKKEVKKEEEGAGKAGEEQTGKVCGVEGGAGCEDCQ